MNHQPKPQQLEAVDGDGCGLRVRFFWQRDRYVHVIEAIGPDVVPLLASDASVADADWPDDPPLQQLSVEPVGADRAALGVGQAGRSHWSLSVESIPGDLPALRFDVACRCTDPPPQGLGSRYRGIAAGQPWSVAGDAAVWDLGPRWVRLSIDAGIGRSRLTCQPDPPLLRIAAAGRRLPVPGPTTASAAGAPPQTPARAQTLRWGFVATSGAQERR